ncbi:GAF domain-containing protein [Streptomyces sp. HB2AG]|uniref:GAF domain-containing protein n=1 Tax=Streptomyces sp. HB2AG TaxID=2983400 RepID=UPI0022AB11EE|nr:GAF domain-containing protein [Streptomyces sp. HB2AG]MCZ2525335.1 GAF domain-containing protein [Streptomyces sp. HB2AG]
MTDYDPVGHILLTPADPDASCRARRLRRLGLGDRPAPALDDFARTLARTARTPWAMVTFVGERHQYFAGLLAPAGLPYDGGLPQAGRAADRGRRVPLDHGFCPYVVVRRKALVLDDVRDYPRFAGNPVVDELGIRSYMGAPLVDHHGQVLGSAAVMDHEPRPWGRQGLGTIKAMARELADGISPPPRGAAPAQAPYGLAQAPYGPAQAPYGPAQAPYGPGGTPYGGTWSAYGDAGAYGG